MVLGVQQHAKRSSLILPDDLPINLLSKGGSETEAAQTVERTTCLDGSQDRGEKISVVALGLFNRLQQSLIHSLVDMLGNVTIVQHDLNTGHKPYPWVKGHHELHLTSAKAISAATPAPIASSKGSFTFFHNLS